MSVRKIIIILVIFSALAAGAYFLFFSKPSVTRMEDSSAPMGQASSTALSSETSIPQGKEKYVHPAFLFSFLVPQDMQIERRVEAGGAETTTFEMADSSLQFQLYIAPYDADAITQSQIVKDTHSTAEGSPQEIVIGSGIHALSFYSDDPALGRLREVWFIMNGHLFEVTAPEGSDAQLVEILNSFEPNRA